MTSSAFAAAAQAAAQQTQNTNPAQDRLIEPEDQQRGGIEARLFGGEKLPSLFNKTHGLNDKVTGIIKDEPFEIQSRTFSQSGAGEPRFWGQDNKPCTDPVDKATGKPNRPIMDMVVPLDTDYRMPAEELAKRQMDSDDGSRGLYLSSEDLKAFKAALRKARITSLAGLVGKRVTMWRSGTRPTGKGNDAWLYTAEITEA